MTWLGIALQGLDVLVVAFVPGALLFRLPVVQRARRAGLPAEERFFWSVLLSLIWSSAVTLALAAVSWYAFDRLFWINVGLSVAVGLGARRRLGYGGTAARPGPAGLLPLGLVVLGASLVFLVPPAEYVVGGKDPGVYFNEGIQIAQRGSFVTLDDDVSSVPPEYRTLFFPPGVEIGYESVRFMGFFVLDIERGAVAGQFPHLYPAWVAIGYGIDGLSGARWVLGWWTVLGVLAVYLVGARLFGRAAGGAGAALLALHVIQVWYGRYPSAEPLMQVLAFAAILAFTRAQVDGDRFFGPVAALAASLCLFAHLMGVFVILGLVAAFAVNLVDGRPTRWGFLLTLGAGTALAVAYQATFLPAYFGRQVVERFGNFQPAQWAWLALAAFAGVASLLAVRVPAIGTAARRWGPAGLVTIINGLAAYAYFFRMPSPTLAVHDAESLRTFVAFYLAPGGLLAALLAFALAGGVWRSLATRAGFLGPWTVFAVFVFYKTRIVPEHFWAARRFLPVILPGMLLLIGAAAFAPVSGDGRWWSRLSKGSASWLRYAAGTLLVVVLGWQFITATRPILQHVEYAGVIPRLEQLASTFGDNDLVIVESRGRSDLHTLALPLAYIYARNVVVLSLITPDRVQFREFVAWAAARYDRLLYLGAGGDELLTRALTVEARSDQLFRVPEYESPVNAYPRRVLQKEFDFTVYEILAHPRESFAIDVGADDNLEVRRFLAKETHANGFTFRWTRDVSTVWLFGAGPEVREVTLWMDTGGRPAAVAGARVDAFLEGQPLGSVTVTEGLRPYRFDIPSDLAARAWTDEYAAELRLETRTWNPTAVGGNDPRDLGVMVDRIEVR